MSRAYCLTCNEQVHETPSGTCPLGHPVTAADHGPEPWVGFADVEGQRVTTDVDRARDEEVAMARLDPTGRHVAHAGAPRNGHADGGHANGHVNGHTVSHSLFDELGDHHSSLDTAPAVGGSSADDLAALLAEALQQEGQPAPESTDQAPERAWEADWDELSGLAAELQLDADHAHDDAPEPPAPEPPPAPEAAVPAAPPAADVDDAAATADLDALLAELSGQAPPEPAPRGLAEPRPSDAPDPVAAEPPASAPPPPPAPPAPPVAPPPPPVADPAPVTGSVDPLEDVPSPSPVDDVAGLWDDSQAAVDDAPPAPEVDLTNFTARGSRVGGGSARPARSWFRKTR